MTRPRVWVAQPLFDDLIEPLREHCEVSVETSIVEHAPAAIAASLRDADGALVTLNESIGAAEIAGAASLRAIANLGVGCNNLDLDVLGDAGIIATNTPDVLTETTADFGWALMMAAARRIGEGERWLRDGHWQQWSFDRLLGHDVHGSTLGILGMGRIGQAIARRAAGFRMRVLYHNRHRVDAAIEREYDAGYVSFETLLAQSDHLVIVLAYSASSHHLIDATALARMKPTAVLVNIARGGIVDDAALTQALSSGRLAAAGLDVFEGEPALHEGLLGLGNVVLTPHIASASRVTRRAMVSVAVGNLLAALGLGAHAGRPPDVVNSAALRRR